IRENRIYRELSSAVAGSHEIAAAAKLYELHREPAFDVIVLDTPPSRNALDFLDAPTRLAGFLEGRALGMVLAAGGLSSGPGASLLPRLVPRSALTRLLGGSSALLLSMFARATGVEMVGDLALFFRLLAPMSDALRERARAVEALLRDQATAFLIVTSPESEPVREARFLHEQLTQLSAPYAALIVNRLHALEAPRNPEALRPLLNDCLGDGPAARVLANLADVSALARRDRESLAVLSAALREPHPVSVPELGGEIDDLAGLAALAEHLLA
ncbi:MAG: ArsA family ATPase, partial [Acidobacteriota bacterium]|nr:ArsA family ATPase [Acidobacteriota bacterium]